LSGVALPKAVILMAKAQREKDKMNKPILTKKALAETKTTAATRADTKGKVRI